MRHVRNKSSTELYAFLHFAACRETLRSRGCPAGVKSMVDLRLLSGDRVPAMRSSCAGRQLLAIDLHSRTDRPAVQISKPASAGRALLDCIADTASAESSREPLGGWSARAARTRRRASRSCRGRPREPPRRPRQVCARCMCVATRHPCTSALTRMLAYHIRLFLGRLWDHCKDSCMSLSDP